MSADELPPALPGRLHRLARPFPALTLGTALLGAGLQLALRDRVPLLRTAFYALSWPLIAALALAAAAAFARRRAAAPAVGGLAVGGAALGLWLSGAIGPGPAPARPGAKVWTAALWNTYRATNPGALHALGAWDPDLLCVVEGPRERATLERAFPRHRVLACRWGLGLAVRAGIAARAVRPVDLGGAGRAARVELDLGGRTLLVVLVALPSNPLRDRAPAFAALARELAGTPGPALVLGDWNTPPASVHFQALAERGLTDAFSAAGEGLRETWPWPLPLLALDQAWGRGLGFVRCQRRWRPVSDHRAVWLEWTF